MQTASSRSALGLFAVTVLLSSYLVFQVQPLISKFILPWFGGTPAVWSTCLLFFQVALFAGYAYAHALVRHAPPRVQCLLHLILLGTALAAVPLAPSPAWKDGAAGAPAASILLLLGATVGLPYFALAATGPLLQAWISARQDLRSPYRLYALSNAGSMAGLVTYPFLIEPSLEVDRQAMGWTLGFLAFVAACGGCAWDTWRAVRRGLPKHQGAGHGPDAAEPVPAGQRTLWVALAGCASVMLLAVTNQVSLDVAAVPFFWVLPLAIYLGSFIVCFDREHWYSRRLFGCLAVLCTVAQVAALRQAEAAPLSVQVVSHTFALAVWCMICHGELVRLKPRPVQLTSFYLHVAAGGAAGGLFVALLAPMVFTGYVELPLGLLACWLVSLLAWRRGRQGALPGRRRAGVACLAVVALLCLAGELRALATMRLEGELEVCRNFYGVLRVAEQPDAATLGHVRCLVHGRILHGQQFTDARREMIPTSYYGETSGVALALAALPRQEGRHIGVVGLGVGTLAAHGRPADRMRFYEINPEVCRLARTRFTYLDRSAARVQIVPGDARLSLQNEPGQAFDLLVLDAFSSDAIPTHLLTREAFSIYARHLASGGALAVHISNRHFDLEPVLRQAADQLGLAAARVHSEADAARGQQAAHWMVLAPPEILQAPALAAAIGKSPQSQRRVQPWTDACTNVLAILK